jgi:hypothetical protein
MFSNMPWDQEPERSPRQRVSVLDCGDAVKRSHRHGVNSRPNRAAAPNASGGRPQSGDSADSIAAVQGVAALAYGVPGEDGSPPQFSPPVPPFALPWIR